MEIMNAKLAQALIIGCLCVSNLISKHINVQKVIFLDNEMVENFMYLCNLENILKFFY